MSYCRGHQLFSSSQVRMTHVTHSLSVIHARPMQHVGWNSRWVSDDTRCLPLSNWIKPFANKVHEALVLHPNVDVRDGYMHTLCMHIYVPTLQKNFTFISLTVSQWKWLLLTPKSKAFLYWHDPDPTDLSICKKALKLPSQMTSVEV